MRIFTPCSDSFPAVIISISSSSGAHGPRAVNRAWTGTTRSAINFISGFSYAIESSKVEIGIVIASGIGPNPILLLAQRGVEAEAAARDSLNATYRRFLSEADPERKGGAEKDPIRAIFGNDAIAEDSIL